MSVFEELRQPVKIPEHDHEAFLAKLGEPIPAPEAIAQDIIELVNETFERLSPHLEAYISDPRRAYGENNVRLESNESRLWDAGKYGEIAIRVCNKPSMQETARAFLSTFYIGDAMRSAWTSHFPFVDGAMTESTKRYQSIGQALILHVLRDRYPRGDTGARESWMKPRDDYSKYPLEDWGERHKVGVELVGVFEDALAPRRRAAWHFGVYHQTRFDKPTPQTEIRSTFEGLVDTRDMDMGVGDFKPIMSKKTRASGTEVAEMSEIFGKTKDIRPLVTPIAKLLKERAATEAMFRNFLEGGSAGA